MHTDREHRLRDNLGQTFLYSRWPQYEDDRQLREEAVIRHRVFARQHLDVISESGTDPFHYGLLDLWLDVYQQPWARPRTLAKLLDDLAEKIATGELRVYLEDSLMWRHSSSGGSGKREMKAEAAPESGGSPRAQTVAKKANGAAPPAFVWPLSSASGGDKENSEASTKSAFRREGDGKHYSAVPMKDRYLNENNEASFLRWNQPKVVTYLSEKEKSSLELDVKDNLIVVKETGQPFDTGEALMGPGAIFIMEPSGRILASNYSKPKEFHHSSLSGGLPVASAGHMEVANGHLLEVNNYSGHYEPTQRQNNLIFQELESRGLPASITDNVMQGGWSEDGVSTEFKPHKNFRNIQ